MGTVQSQEDSADPSPTGSAPSDPEELGTDEYVTQNIMGMAMLGKPEALARMAQAAMVSHPVDELNLDDHDVTKRKQISRPEVLQAAKAAMAGGEVERAFEQAASGDGVLHTEAQLHAMLFRLHLVQQEAETRRIFSHCGARALLTWNAFLDIVEALLQYLAAEEENAGKVDYVACHRAITRMGLQVVGEKIVEALRRQDEVTALIELADFVCLTYDLKGVDTDQHPASATGKRMLPSTFSGSFKQAGSFKQTGALRQLSTVLAHALRRDGRRSVGNRVLTRV